MIRALTWIGLVCWIVLTLTDLYLCGSGIENTYGWGNIFIRDIALVAACITSLTNEDE